MKAEFETLLCQRYPLIFSERYRSVSESAMGFGFSCGDGWLDLIDVLCEQLQSCSDYSQAPQVVASQVKEKFGQLSFYLLGNASPEQRGMITMAQSMSARICELCGKPAQTLVCGYACLTRCSEHAPAGAVPAAVTQRISW
jgi:hypothetical protein